MPGLAALHRMDAWVVALELIVLIAVMVSLGPVVRAWLNVWGLLLLFGVIGIGMVLPLLLYWRGNMAAARINDDGCRAGAGRRFYCCAWSSYFPLKECEMKLTLIALLIALFALTACDSPETARSRGGGPGADVGNRAKVVEMHEGSQPFWQDTANYSHQTSAFGARQPGR